MLRLVAQDEWICMHCDSTLACDHSLEKPILRLIGRGLVLRHFFTKACHLDGWKKAHHPSVALLLSGNHLCGRNGAVETRVRP